MENHEFPPDLVWLSLRNPLIMPSIDRRYRDGVTSLWHLDARLCELRWRVREPALRQIRLAWWRAQIAALGHDSGPPEPLLVTLAAHVLPRVDAARLAELVDMWEPLLVLDVPDATEITAFAHVYGPALFGLTGDILGHDAMDQAGHAAAEHWGAVRHCALSNPMAADVHAMCAAMMPPSRAVPCVPKPLRMLGRLSRRVSRTLDQRSRWREQLGLLRGAFSR